MRLLKKRSTLVTAALLGYLALACAIQGREHIARHRWWSGLGPVLPHDSFPADCSLCHEGDGWGQLVEDFAFDHEAETGVPLEGAHAQARCIRCHNDRGPVDIFAAQGCVGCHEDVHYGELTQSCDECHREQTWQPVGQIQLHTRTRFPLEGVHQSVACQRCHPGALVGNFIPTSTRCDVCHQRDMLQTNNPNHVGLGWVDRCDRCHIPISWNRAEIP